MVSSFSYTASSSETAVPASIRISSDLAVGSQCLRHSAALRIVDNHLHTTNFLPGSYREPRAVSSNSNIDKYCVGQAVTTYRHPPLLDLLHDRENQMLVKSHVWLAGVGNGSSLTFGGAVTLADLTLATCSRVFVRVDATDQNTGEERGSKFCLGDDCDGKGRFGFSIPEVKQISFGSGDANAKPELSKAGEEVLAVRVGPQHMNHGDHVDHAFLADTASHALHLADPKAGMELLTKADQSTLSVQYLAAGHLGKTLNCYAKNNDRWSIIASTWGESDAGTNQLLTLAEW
eukprot:CAMPEP_0181130306 /NCGR_PEP_ID=MMETSP1071-20121207/29791_1 /TAXON_ID=35127 /ORGANISM="Thalassiosira sp., Strain NH16" /LENGTH=289 /DNA_ID=CAMNT_0023216363 /DNA_START=167 /DNA_END=1034 /DNA_ORIENTATION=+